MDSLRMARPLRIFQSLLFSLLITGSVGADTTATSSDLNRYAHPGVPVYKTQELAGVYWVQVYASVSDPSDAQELSGLRGEPLTTAQDQQGLYRVLMGPYQSYQSASAAVSRASANNISDAFVRFSASSIVVPQQYWLQVFALRNTPDVDALQDRFPTKRIKISKSRSGFHQVLVGPFSSRAAADSYKLNTTGAGDALVRALSSVSDQVLAAEVKTDDLPELGKEISPPHLSGSESFVVEKLILIASGVESDSTAAVRQELAQEVTTEVVRGAVQQFESSDYNPFQWLAVEVTLPDGSRDWTYALDTHYTLFEDDARNVFLQGGVRRLDAGRQSYDPKSVTGDSIGKATSELSTTYNVGVGYRELTDNEQWLLGGNVFYDYQVQGQHKRASLGLEALSDSFDVIANVYKGLSGWRESSWSTDQKHQVMDGVDLGVKGRIPGVPALELGITGYKYFGHEGRDDLTGSSISAEYQPFSAMTFGIEHDRPESGSSDTQAKIEFLYKFGVPLKAQFEPVKFESNSVRHRRYEKVDREYGIKVQSDQDVADLPGVTSSIMVGGLEFFRPQLERESISPVGQSFPVNGYDWAAFNGVLEPQVLVTTPTSFIDKSATSHCQARGLRLPTVSELNALYAQEGDMSAHGWPNAIRLYWSSTIYVDPTNTRTYLMHLINGIDGSGHIIYNHYVSCVR